MATVAEQLHKDWSRDAELLYARVGIFGALTLHKYAKSRAKINQGVCPTNSEDWYIDQWGPHPIRIGRLHLNVEKRNAANWNAIEISSPLYAIPHALSRYRERTGRFIKSELFWQIPYFPRVRMIDEHSRELTRMQTNSIVPAGDLGIWMGYTTSSDSGTIVFRYKKHQVKLHNPGQTESHFYACTFISNHMMTDEQKQIAQAYRDGEYEVYEDLMQAYGEKYPNSLFNHDG